MKMMRAEMRISLFFLFASSLSFLPGCGNSGPADGTAATPVNEEEAKAQNAAMQDAMKSKMKPSAKK